MIAGNRRRNGEGSRDRGAQRQRANNGERDLADAEGESAGDNADEQRADDACAAVKRRRPGRQSNELCDVLRYVAQTRRMFLWSPIAGFSRHIFLYG
jgi:hypothetical protein